MDTFLKDILFKLNLKQIGKNLSIYANLYIKPVDAWKKINQEKDEEAYDFLILHMIYYSIFIFVIIKDFTSTIPIVALDILVTIIPFCIYFIPYKLFGKVCHLNLGSKKIFRLLLLYKLQYLPITIIFVLLAKASNNNLIYIIADNLYALSVLGYILILPLINRINVWKKFLWIFANYLFFLLSVVLSTYFVMYSKDFESLEYEFLLPSPVNEILIYKRSSLEFIEKTSPEYYMITYKQEKSKLKDFKTQFVSSDLAVSFLSTAINSNNKKIIRISKAYKDSLQWRPKSRELNLRKLDSFRLDMNRRFSNDSLITSKFVDSTKFPQNKIYFQKVENFLKDYNKQYLDFDSVMAVIDEKNDKEFIDLENETTVLLCKPKSQILVARKEEIELLEAEFEKNFYRSKFIVWILTFPIQSVSY